MIKRMLKMIFKQLFTTKCIPNQLQYHLHLEFHLDHTHYKQLVDFIESCNLKRTDSPHDLPNSHFHAHDFYQSIDYKCDGQTHQRIQTYFESLPVMSDHEIEWAEHMNDALLSSGVTCSNNFNLNTRKYK